MNAEGVRTNGRLDDKGTVRNKQMEKGGTEAREVILNAPQNSGSAAAQSQSASTSSRYQARHRSPLKTFSLRSCA